MPRTKSLILLPLFAAMISVILAAAAFADVSRFTQVESFSESSADISTTYDAGANPDDGSSPNNMRWVSGDTASKTVTFNGTSNSNQIEVRARGVNTDGTMPKVRVFIDGTAYPADLLMNQQVSSGYTTYSASINESPGSHTLYVKMADWSAGDKVFVDFLRVRNPGTDTTPPQLTKVSGPGDTSDGQADFVFQSSETLDSIGCAVHTNTNTVFYEYEAIPCSLTPSFPGLANGPYYLFTVAEDLAGNKDSDIYPFRVGPVPVPTIVSGPDASSHDAEPEFVYSVDETRTTFECDITASDGPDWDPFYCTSGSDPSAGFVKYPGREFELKVRTVDEAGNRSDWTDPYAWTYVGP